MKEVYFVRHGKSEENHDGNFGARDADLTEEGIKQIKAAVGDIKKLPHIDLIITSTLTRAQKSAEIIAKGINYPASDIKQDERIVELDHGDMEGLVRDAAGEQLREQYFLDENNTLKVETLSMMVDRLTNFVDEMKAYPEQTILIVGHGFCSRMLARVLNGMDPKKPLPRLKNADLIKIYPYEYIEAERKWAL